jgi:DNA-binding CsgD family transcriptional regulator
MFLSIRPTVPEDLPGVFLFIRKRFHIPATETKDLQKMWTRILLEGECNCTVIEDTDRPEGEQIVSYIMTYCVPAPMVDFARTQAPPFLWRWTLQRWKQGQPVWLDKKEARKIQVDGQISVIGHIAADVYRYSGIELGRINNMHSATAARDLAGQRVHYYLTEVYDLVMRERFISHGFKVLSDYRSFQDDPAYAALPVKERPFLMLADLHKAAEDMSLQDTSIGRAALSGTPRYGFSEPEQEVMKLGLLGLTDQGIAERLGLSLVAIKKRWEGIYDKVNEKSFRQALENTDDGGAPAKAGRRQVLQMMAEHPEEFRPSPAKKRSLK